MQKLLSMTLVINKMLKYVGVILVTSLFLLSMEGEGYAQHPIANDAKQVRIAYQKLKKNGDLKINEYNYLERFPGSFNQFNELFGYPGFNNSENPGPLYEDSYVYIDAFFNLSRVNRIELYGKIISISINGKWDSDGVGYFQNKMEEEVAKELVAFCNLLASRTDKEIRSFWYFYFDGPHPEKGIPPLLKNISQLEQVDPRIYKLMKEASKEVWVYWKNSHE